MSEKIEGLDELDSLLGGGKSNEKKVKIDTNIVIENDVENISNSTYVVVDMNLLPGKKYYRTNTVIKIKKPESIDIQKFLSIPDSGSYGGNLSGLYYLQVMEKLTELVKSCTKVFVNGVEISNDCIKTDDLIPLSLLIKELKYPNHDVKNAIKCDKCKKDDEYPVRLGKNKTLFLRDFEDDYEHLFNDEKKCYEFNINSIIYEVAPSNIGINATFIKEYLLPAYTKGGEINVIFMAVYSLLKYKDYSITKKGIDEKLKEFEKSFDEEAMQVLYQFSQTLLISKSDLKCNCSNCGSEIEDEFTHLHSGFKSLFTNESALDKFKKKN